MELKVFLLFSLAAVAFAAPAKKMASDDMMVAEGRSLHSYAAPPAPRHLGGGTVTSYNRRGSYAQASDLTKPSIYGSSYSAPAAIGASSYGSAAPFGGYAPARRYPSPQLSHDQQSYGPQRNTFSEQSRHISQDPNYDAAKDPVSQYAAYVPVFEYAPKGHTQGNELSIYGYRK